MIGRQAAAGYVLVPFAGSGSECCAAKKLQLPFIGIELNADYIAIIHQRLQDSGKNEADPHLYESVPDATV